MAAPWPGNPAMEAATCLENHREVNGGCRNYGSWSWENDEIWIPSGNLLQFAIEHGHRNSGFSH